MFYGYAFSGLVFFYAYRKIKLWMSLYLIDQESKEMSLWHVFMMSAGASVIAEILSLGFYYPYDLIKTRMQSMHDKYRYRNITDAGIKMMNESTTMQFKNFYKGSFLYSINFVSLIAIELSLYESFLAYLKHISP